MGKRDWREKGTVEKHSQAEIRAVLGARLAAARAKMGFSQNQLAERIGISPAYVTMLEGGHRTGSVELFLAWAAACEVPRGAAHFLLGLEKALKEAASDAVEAEE